MRKLLLLLKTQLNARYGFSRIQYNLKNDKKSFYKSLGLALVVLIAAVQLVGLYTLLMFNIHKAAQSISTPEIILTMSAVVSGLVILFFGIFHILGALFLAKDSEFLTSLPLPQGSVFMSKFLMVLLTKYPIAVFLMMPPVIIYGIGAGKGVLYYLLALICILLLPLVPLIISSFFSLILMNIVGRSKRRDLMTTLGSIILLVGFFVGQNLLISRIPEDSKEFMASFQQTSSAFVEFTGKAFPPSVWITKILSSGAMESLINLLYLTLVSLTAFVVVYFLASFIYQKGANAQLETQAKPIKKKLAYKASSHVITMFKNEWRIILRTPIYAMNSLVVVFMLPLLFFLPMLGGNFANDPDIKFLFDLMESGKSQSTILLILAGVISFLALINPAISSTFSREGKAFWILKNIPVKPETQAFGKLLAGYSISFAAAFLAVIIAVFSLKVPVNLAVMLLVLCSLALIPVSALNLIIDLIRPKLSWDNPQEAIKQNANVVIGMLCGFLMILVFGVIGYFINTLTTSVYVVFAVMAVLLVIVSDLSIHLVQNIARSSYLKIEP